MKKIYTLIITVASLLLVCSCEDDIQPVQIPLSIDKDKIEFTADAQTVYCKLSASVKPSVTVPDWISCKIDIKGEKNVWLASLSCEKNSSEEARNDVIKIYCKNTTKVIPVFQAGKTRQETETSPEEQPDKENPEDNTADEDTETGEIKPDDNPKDDEQTSDTEIQESSETVLLAIQRKYYFYSAIETENDITVYFQEPTPVTINGHEYPEGIQKIRIFKDDLKESGGYYDYGEQLVFKFKSGNRATLNIKDQKIKITSDKPVIEMERWTDDGKNYTCSVNFTVEGARPELMKISYDEDSGSPVCKEFKHNEDGSFTATFESSCSDHLSLNADDIHSQPAIINIERQGLMSMPVSFVELNIHMNYDGLDTPEQKKLREALIDFYNACNGEKWLRNCQWKYLDEFPEHAEDFQGISMVVTHCENKRPLRLFKIYIYDNEMCGIVPQSFWESLKYCKWLSIRFGESSPRNEVPDYAYGPYNEFFKIIYENSIVIPLETK